MAFCALEVVYIYLQKLLKINPLKLQFACVGPAGSGIPSGSGDDFPAAGEETPRAGFGSLHHNRRSSGQSGSRRLDHSLRLGNPEPL